MAMATLRSASSTRSKASLQPVRTVLRVDGALHVFTHRAVVDRIEFGRIECACQHEILQRFLSTSDLDLRHAEAEVDLGTAIDGEAALVRCDGPVVLMLNAVTECDQQRWIDFQRVDVAVAQTVECAAS